MSILATLVFVVGCSNLKYAGDIQIPAKVTEVARTSIKVSVNFMETEDGLSRKVYKEFGKKYFKSFNPAVRDCVKVWVSLYSRNGKVFYDGEVLTGVDGMTVLTNRELELCD